jgi:hypothetical protein
MLLVKLNSIQRSKAYSFRPKLNVVVGLDMAAKEEEERPKYPYQHCVLSLALFFPYLDPAAATSRVIDGR